MTTRTIPPKPSREVLEAINSSVHYAMFSVFAATSPLGEDRDAMGAEVEALFEELRASGVRIRGTYDVAGLRADADLMIWWHAEEFSDIQKAFGDFRRETTLGQVSEVTWIGNALHRPAEFNKSHLPSFIMGEEPKEWIAVYPFVRSYDWYTMDEQKRRRILMEHGMQARDYPDVRANTVPAFALGDYEWVLAFEADELHRIVDLMYKMRYTEARHHVREEIPFHTGRRVKDVAELIAVLP